MTCYLREPECGCTKMEAWLQCVWALLSVFIPQGNVKRENKTSKLKSRNIKTGSMSLMCQRIRGHMWLAMCVYSPPKPFTCQSNPWAPPSSSSIPPTSPPPLLQASFLLPSTFGDASKAFYSSPSRHLSLHSVTPSCSPSHCPFNCVFAPSPCSVPLGPTRSRSVRKMNFHWEIFLAGLTSAGEETLDATRSWEPSILKMWRVCVTAWLCVEEMRGACVEFFGNSPHSEVWSNSWISSPSVCPSVPPRSAAGESSSSPHVYSCCTCLEESFGDPEMNLRHSR